MRVSVAFIVLFALMSGAVQPPVMAQPAPEGPPQEVRAFWLTTVLGLDWPKTEDPVQAEASLRQIIREAYDLNLNTVIFQAVSRGDAMYESERLPWSVWLTGTPGQDPGWDPLAVAIEESHSLGMDFHAWFNVYRIGDTTTPVVEEGEPRHVTVDNPHWVEQRNNELWLNPAFPELREWLIGNVMEIVENYDVDAIHFDFIRTATSGYARDQQLMQEYPHEGVNFLNDWRRENINVFVREVYAQVKEAKPWVKVGSAPVGNYSSECWHAVLEGRNAVFQDSRRWAQEEVHDYIAPQIYWDIDNNPKFDCLTRAWMANRHGRHIYVGMAPYVDAVRVEIPRQIDTTRVNNAHGQVYFRWDHVREVGGWFPRESPVGDRYDYPALLPAMEWNPGVAPATPPNFNITFDDSLRTVDLTWDVPDADPGDALRGYAIYRAFGNYVDPEVREHLVAVVGPETTVLTDSFQVVPEEGVAYRVVAFSRLSAHSVPTAALWTDFTSVSSEDEAVVSNFGLTGPYPNPAAGAARAHYEIEKAGQVHVKLYDMLGREIAVLEAGLRSAGRHEVVFDASTLAGGVYLLTLESDGRRESRRLIVTR